MKTLYIITCPLVRFLSWVDTNNLLAQDLDILIKDISFKGDKNFNQVFYYYEKTLTAEEKEVLKKVKDGNYDQVIFFYNNPHAKGYEGIEKFCLLTKIPQVKAVKTDDSVKVIKKRILFFKQAKELIFFIIDILLAAFLFIIFFPLLLICNFIFSSFIRKKTILFSSVGGKYSASFRVRCQNFAEKISSYGIDACSYDFWPLDKIFVQEGNLWFLNFYDTRRVIFIICAVFTINFKFRRFENLYAQKVDLACIASYLSTLFSWRRLYIDVDDWDHDAFGEIFKRFSAFSFFKYNNLFYFIINESQGVITASEWLNDHILKNCNQHVLYAPTAVDDDIFYYQPRDTEKKLVVSWMGTIYKKQSEWLIYLLDIWKSMDTGDSVLEIMGDGSFLKLVQNYAMKNKINNILFLDWHPFNEISSYLDRVDIGLFPITNIGDYENAKSPTKLFEYMAKGIPSVVSKTRETNIIINNGFSGFLAETEEEFIKALILLINDKECRERTGRNARQIIEIFYNLNKSVLDIHDFIFGEDV